MPKLPFDRSGAVTGWWIAMAIPFLLLHHSRQQQLPVRSWSRLVPISSSRSQDKIQKIDVFDPQEHGTPERHTWQEGDHFGLSDLRERDVDGIMIGPIIGVTVFSLTT